MHAKVTNVTRNRIKKINGKSWTKYNITKYSCDQFNQCDYIQNRIILKMFLNNFQLAVSILSSEAKALLELFYH